ncbi:uncharacterized protein LOC110098000 isoform X2 [Dendrobium catenatum]|uniref:uncharacterized protein LOC110098000 isoform X2 n=1 Tax=Dendrobium catenatum TaxID=906689 RepID=UPI0009F54649|nr:uncharacterized protein LOC110098000 isoform X2 [Dendrobium catenatum]
MKIGKGILAYMSDGMGRPAERGLASGRGIGLSDSGHGSDSGKLTWHYSSRLEPNPIFEPEPEPPSANRVRESPVLLLFDFASWMMFPSGRIGSYNILIGSNDGRLLVVKDSPFVVVRLRCSLDNIPFRSYRKLQHFDQNQRWEFTRYECLSPFHVFLLPNLINKPELHDFGSKSSHSLVF